MTQSPTMRLLKLATDEDNKEALEIIEDSKKSIEYYYSLPPEQFAQLNHRLQNALNKLKSMYAANESMQMSLDELNTPTIPVHIFARRYYRWLRGEPVPPEILKAFNKTSHEYCQILFNEWRNNVGRATSPVYVIGDQGEKIYLLPSLHCKDMISVKEQYGFVEKTQEGDYYHHSSGAINDNINKIELFQSEDQKQMAFKQLMDHTVIVNGASENGPNQWLEDWRKAIVFFDQAFGLTPLESATVTSTNSATSIDNKSGYSGSLDELF